MTDATRLSVRQAHRERERRLLADYADLSTDDPRRAPIRDELITMHLPLVRHLAGRYRGKGESLEDLVQVGTIGLINAVDRFDPRRGTEFSTFATPTIIGEIKRHFRDRAWALRVPRRLQDLQARVQATADELTMALHRAPTVRELAAALSVPEEDVLDALEARHAYGVGTLDADRPDGSEGTTDVLGEVDPGFDAVDDREALRPLIAALPERERRIVTMRFVENLSQSQIATRLGISQMHVSRLLARTLAHLRNGLSEAY